MTPTQQKTEELAQQWGRFVKIGEPKYLPNPYDVGINKIRQSVDRIIEKITA